MRVRSAFPLLTVFLVALSPTFVAAQQPITVRDLWSMARVGSPALSPDGSTVLYTVTTYDQAEYRSSTEIWAVPMAGGEPRPFITSGQGSSSGPAWSPDGRRIAFVSTRGGNGPQVWLIPVDGGEARQLTNVEGGATGPVWSADGLTILFASSVTPVGDATAQRLEEIAEAGSQAKVYDELQYRHWDEWEDGLRSHVFLLNVATGATRDVTPGPYDTPPIALGGFADYDISPDGQEVAFVRNTDVPSMVGTGNDIWLVPAAGGEPRLLTESDANDVSPQYSPDGRWIAYLGMTRPAFEADRTQLRLHDRRTGDTRSLTADLDASVDFFAWSADSGSLWFQAQDQLHHATYRVSVAGGAPVKVIQGTYDGGLQVSADQRTLVVARQATDRPVDLFAVDADGQLIRQLTHQNRELVDRLSLQPAEPFWATGDGGTPVQGFLVKPPGFDPSRKYPLVLLIHGGPQGAWTDSWSYRWNPNMFAAPGYVVVAVNPRGSTGYGQKFVDEITGDWGGKVYTDLMNGLDHALTTYTFLDESRMAAAGASYGGYMINWLNGHTDRFRALINHDGLFDTRSMYGATEELWFPEWEFGGQPWTNPEGFERWNPANHVAGMKTPTLVIHGGMDYRVPLDQGLSTFTALRRRGVAARLLYFPDEGHWVLKPQNATVWWEEMIGWLERYLSGRDVS
jgi:dipeptidyl aminopeptidase/acylaminoacyl peptidase